MTMGFPPLSFGSVCVFGVATGYGVCEGRFGGVEDSIRLGMNESASLPA